MEVKQRGVFVVFRMGDYFIFGDDLQMIYSLGGRECHAEVLVNDTAFSAQSQFCDAVIARNIPDMLKYDGIEWVKIPVKEDKIHTAIDFLQSACKTHALFEIPLLDFLFPSLVTNLIDVDNKEECVHPEEWKHLYCSKFVLFFLRFCDRMDALDISKEKVRPLWEINSNRCSPVMLRRLVTRAFDGAAMRMGSCCSRGYICPACSARL